MTEFQLVITRRVLNEQYEEQLKEWREKTRYGGFSEGGPTPWTEEKVLSVLVDEDTFAAIRKAALETL